MKKNRKLLSLFAVILILVLCVSTLVACSGKPKEIKPQDFQDALINAINGKLPGNGYYFGIDASVSCTVDTAGVVAKYDFAVQGTLDTDPKTDSADSQLKIELKETKGSQTKTLLGVYYKDQKDGGAANYEANAPKLFLNLNDEYKFAYNTYSIKKLLKDLDKTSKTSDMLSIAGMEITPETIISLLLLTMANPETYRTQTVKKEVINTVELNVQGLFNFIKDLITSNSDKIDGILGALDTNLSAEVLAGLDLDIPILLTTKYTKVKKNQTPQFLGANLAIDFNKNRPIQIKILGQTIIDTAIPQCKVNVELGKLEFTSDQKVEISLPIDDGYTLINPINISLDGKLNITDTKSNKKTAYDVILRVDANPIPIAYGFNGWDIKEAVFKSLGMIHFSIISADRKTALIDIAYDPAHTGSDSVYATINLGTFGPVNTQFSLSALEGMMDSITAFMNNKTDFYGVAPKEVKTLTNVADGDITNWLDTLKPFVADLLTGGLEGLLGTFDVKLSDAVKETLVKVNTMVQDMITKGDIKLGTIARPTQENVFVELDIQTVAAKILGSGIINIPENTLKLINNLLGLVNSILGGNLINLEFTDVGYGTVAHNYNATQFFSANRRGDGNFIQAVTGFNDASISTKMTEGITAEEFMNIIEFRKPVAMKYTNYKNGSAFKPLKPMLVTGFDPSAIGVQLVTVGFMDDSGHGAMKTILGIVGDFLPDKSLLDKIPFGLVRYTFEVKIIA